MPAVPCTGALRRKLPTGHPSMAGCRGTSPHEALEARGDTGSLPTACRTSRVQRRDVIQRVQGDTTPAPVNGLDMAGSKASGEKLTGTRDGTRRAVETANDQRDEWRTGELALRPGRHRRPQLATPGSPWKKSVRCVGPVTQLGDERLSERAPPVSIWPPRRVSDPPSVRSDARSSPKSPKEPAPGGSGACRPRSGNAAAARGCSRPPG